jgi:hypothetical protein
MLTVEETTVIDRSWQGGVRRRGGHRDPPDVDQQHPRISDAERPGLREDGDRNVVISKVAGRRFTSIKEVTEVQPARACLADGAVAIITAHHTTGNVRGFRLAGLRAADFA